ncbi:MAG: hypothetical protein JWN68_2483 [Nocardioides sp.]|nr:hypothetical protein [Nocardioides sp.]
MTVRGLAPGTFDSATGSGRHYCAGRYCDSVEVMKRFTHIVDGDLLPHDNCRFCHEQIVQVSDIGWLDPTPGDTYDLCPSGPYGDHEPSDAPIETRARVRLPHAR